MAEDGKSKALRLKAYIKALGENRREFKMERPNPSEAFEENVSAPVDKTKTETAPYSLELAADEGIPSRVSQLKKLRMKYPKFAEVKQREYKPIKELHGNGRPTGEEQKGIQPGRREY